MDTTRRAEDLRGTLTHLSEDWFSLSDLHWPGQPGSTIKHVVVGPTGVVVIDPTSASRAKQAAEAISELLPAVDPRFITPMVCTSGATKTEIHGVRVCSPETLVSVLENRPSVIMPSERQFIRFDLDMSTDHITSSVDHRRQRTSLLANGPRQRRRHPSMRTPLRYRERPNMRQMARSLVARIFGF